MANCFQIRIQQENIFFSRTYLQTSPLEILLHASRLNSYHSFPKFYEAAKRYIERARARAREGEREGGMEGGGEGRGGGGVAPPSTAPPVVKIGDAKRRWQENPVPPIRLEDVVPPEERAQHAPSASGDDTSSSSQTNLWQVFVASSFSFLFCVDGLIKNLQIYKGKDMLEFPNCLNRGSNRFLDYPAEQFCNRILHNVLLIHFSLSAPCIILF